jgi:hypothetical protein
VNKYIARAQPHWLFQLFGFLVASVFMKAQEFVFKLTAEEAFRPHLAIEYSLGAMSRLDALEARGLPTFRLASLGLLNIAHICVQ